MPLWRTQYPGVENMSVAVMGCGGQRAGRGRRGIGISLWPGPGAVFVDGERTVRSSDHIAEEFQAIVEDYVARRYGAPH